MPRASRERMLELSRMASRAALLKRIERQAEARKGIAERELAHAESVAERQKRRQRRRGLRASTPRDLSLSMELTPPASASQSAPLESIADQQEREEARLLGQYDGARGLPRHDAGRFHGPDQLFAEYCRGFDEGVAAGTFPVPVQE